MCLSLCILKPLVLLLGDEFIIKTLHEVCSVLTMVAMTNSSFCVNCTVRVVLSRCHDNNFVRWVILILIRSCMKFKVNDMAH